MEEKGKRSRGDFQSIGVVTDESCEKVRVSPKEESGEQKSAGGNPCGTFRISLNFLKSLLFSEVPTRQTQHGGAVDVLEDVEETEQCLDNRKPRVLETSNSNDNHVDAYDKDTAVNDFLHSEDEGFADVEKKVCSKFSDSTSYGRKVDFCNDEVDQKIECQADDRRPSRHRDSEFRESESAEDEEDVEDEVHEGTEDASEEYPLRRIMDSKMGAEGEEKQLKRHIETHRNGILYALLQCRSPKIIDCGEKIFSLKEE